MNNQEIQNELLQVQKEIAELPAGYLSKKNINGKTRYYLITSKKNSRTIYSRVLYRYSFFSFPMGTALFGARLFLYKLKILQVKNRKRFT